MNIRKRNTATIAGLAFAGMTLALGAPATSSAQTTPTTQHTAAVQGCSYWDGWDCDGWDDWDGDWNWNSNWNGGWYDW